MTAGALTVFLAYLGKFFKPVQDLAKMSNAIAQANVALERVQSILDVDMRIPERADARKPEDRDGQHREDGGCRCVRHAPGHPCDHPDERTHDARAPAGAGRSRP